LAARERHLDWDGCFNVRDLGGLPTVDGRLTRRGAVVRADSLDDLTPAGWQALWEHGVRTVVDLRNDDERGDPGVAQRPAGLETVHVPIDAIDESDFWEDWYNGPQFATPLYYAPHLERFPERSAAAVAAIADAPPGGVAFHCASGRDRSGQVTMLVLSLCGVAPAEIGADYGLSAQRLTARYAAAGEDDMGLTLAAFLAERGTDAGAVIAATLATVDVEQRLKGGGLRDEQVSALRRRLVDGY
jgi:protein tyrosine/serine phosphatase